MEEREFELINIIGGRMGANQRDLAREMELSLGMTNMLIRRLITKGYIRIRQLNKKKVEYILTPRGFSEKMRKSVHYTLKTISSIGLIKQRISGLLRAAHERGIGRFYIIGGSDLAGLVEMTAREEFGPRVVLVRSESVAADMNDGLVLVCREEKKEETASGLEVVHVIEELARMPEAVSWRPWSDTSVRERA